MGWTKTATDDVTGELYPESDASEIKITVGDASGLLVIGAGTLAALTELVKGDAGPLRTLLTPAAPVIRAGRKRSGGSREGKPDDDTGATSDEIRAWCRDNGVAVNARGRIGADARALFRASRPAAGKTAVKPAPAVAEPAPAASVK